MLKHVKNPLNERPCCLFAMSLSALVKELGESTPTRAQEIASEARKAISSSRRLLSDAGSAASASVASVGPVRGGRVVPEDEALALEVEHSFDVALRKQQKALKAAEQARAKAQEERVAFESSAAAKLKDLKEETEALRLEVKRSEGVARQRAAEQRELRQELQREIESSKVSLLAMVQQNEEQMKKKQATLRKKRNRWKRLKETCSEIVLPPESKDHRLQILESAFNDVRHVVVEASALARALRSRMPEDVAAEGRCDTGGSDSLAARRQAETTESVPAEATEVLERCRVLREEAQLLVSELSASEIRESERSESCSETPSLLGCLAKELQQRQETSAQFQELLLHLQKQVLNSAVPSSRSLEVRCEAEGLRELCQVEQRIEEHYMDLDLTLIEDGAQGDVSISEAKLSPGFA